jgi:hypothetical protein
MVTDGRFQGASLKDALQKANSIIRDQLSSGLWTARDLAPDVFSPNLALVRQNLYGVNERLEVVLEEIMRQAVQLIAAVVIFPSRDIVHLRDADKALKVMSDIKTVNPRSPSVSRFPPMFRRDFTACSAAHTLLSES